MKRYISFLTALGLCLALLGCGTRAAAADEAAIAAITQDMETDVEEEPTVDANITLSDGSSRSESSSVTVGGDVVTITAAGTYRLTGTLTNGQIVVDAADAKVTLLLDGVRVSNNGSAALYVVEADKVTLFLAEGSENTLASAGEFAESDDGIDAAVFAHDDVTVRGSGSLDVTSETGHGIVTKDDLKIKDGTLTVTAARKGLSANDSVEINGGVITVTAGTDAIHVENTDDTAKGTFALEDGTITLSAGNDGVDASGTVTIEGGTMYITSGTAMTQTDSGKGIKSAQSITVSGGALAINARDDGVHSDGDVTITGGQLAIASADDGVHAQTLLQIDGGELAISAMEGLEGTYVKITGGTIQIKASDDGINAGRKSSAYTPTVEITGGDITIEMGSGDTDGIDSNGNILVSGGTIRITGNSSFDYDGSAQFTGGTIIVNGQQIDYIPNQMMGGRGGFGGQGSFGDQGSFGGWGSWGGQTPGGQGGFGGRGRG